MCSPFIDLSTKIGNLRNKDGCNLGSFLIKPSVENPTSHFKKHENDFLRRVKKVNKAEIEKTLKKRQYVFSLLISCTFPKHVLILKWNPSLDFPLLLHKIPQLSLLKPPLYLHQCSQDTLLAQRYCKTRIFKTRTKYWTETVTTIVQKSREIVK